MRKNTHISECLRQCDYESIEIRLQKHYLGTLYSYTRQVAATAPGEDEKPLQQYFTNKKVAQKSR
ncbi:hypothetical protein [uncultured Megasphaera sp.]|uniref:hypothetical protein n=1 Tax=uncultured Megasphaera sp. TaxID=165188 RepID=UPI00259775D3|nr:hypothetical protein [uncultured Megasphaera sp.]